MLNCFNLKDVRSTSAYGQTTIHIYLDENEKSAKNNRKKRKYQLKRVLLQKHFVFLHLLVEFAQLIHM